MDEEEQVEHTCRFFIMISDLSIKQNERIYIK